MQFRAIQRILGLLLMIFSFTMLPPVAVAWWYQDGEMMPFLLGFVLILTAGFLFWAPVRHFRRELRVRDGFVVAMMFWIALGFSGAVPLMLSDRPHMTLTNAMFESFSGLTTTGASVLSGLDSLPHAINFYRLQLHFMGGMGIIVLAVAIMPMLGVGGMQLFRAETSGPMKDTKLTPRIKETAMKLWYVYVGLTGLCAVAFWLAGMDVFDAVTHSFSVLSTGGFSTHDASLGYFHSPVIDAIAVVFMVLGGINFTLHFLVWRERSPMSYLTDAETRAYMIVLTLISALVTAYLYGYGTFTDFGEALHHGVFQAISIGTTSGLVTTGFGDWPGFVQMLLLFASFICGCAGSTAGGIKMIRFQLLLTQGLREIRRLIHPQSVTLVKVNGRAVPERVTEAVWGFFSVYVAVFMISMLALMATGINQDIAFSAVTACLNNMGVGLGDFASLNNVAKWVLSVDMVMGRLEIFTLLVLLAPAFWRR